jgi:hypothetical protein
MERPDPNIMPKFNLGIARELGNKLIGLCSYFPSEAGYPSEYRTPEVCPDEVEPVEMRLPGFDANGEYREA